MSQDLPIFWSMFFRQKRFNFEVFFLNSFLQAGKMVANWCCRRRCLRVSVTRSRVCPKVKNRKEVSWHSASEEQARTAQPPLGQSFWCVAESVLFWAHARQRVLSFFAPKRVFSLFFSELMTQNLQQNASIELCMRKKMSVETLRVRGSTQVFNYSWRQSFFIDSEIVCAQFVCVLCSILAFFSIVFRFLF